MNKSAGASRYQSAIEWASKMNAIPSGGSMRMPPTIMRLRYEGEKGGGYLPFLMPPGTYSRGLDDLVTFVPDWEATERR